MTGRRFPTDDELARGFSPEDDGTTRGEAPDHIIRLVRAAYEEGRRLEARRHFGDTLAERNAG